MSIRMFDDPILKTVCEKVSFEKGLKVGELLKTELKKHNNGVGLAAPQIGINARVILVKPNSTLPGLLLINPEIIEHSEETILGNEGCLSYPNFYCDVERYRSVKVKYVTRLGKEIAELFTMWDARIVQHEIDHLNGICKIGDYWKTQEGAVI